MATAIEQLKAAVASREAEASATYWRWVTRAAAGEEVDPQALLADLDRLGRDPDKFQSDAEALAERRRLLAVVATRPAAEARYRAAAEAVRAAERRLEDAIREGRAEVARHQGEASRAVQEIASIKAAERQLRETADPAIAAERQKAYATLDRLTARERAVVEGMERCRTPFAREAAEAELAEVRRQKQAAQDHLQWLSQEALSE